MFKPKVLFAYAIVAALVLGLVPQWAPRAGAYIPSVGSSWTYGWEYRGYYQRYKTYCYYGRSYRIYAQPETRWDDPDLYVGTSSPRATNCYWVSPSNYWWSSTRGRGYTDSVYFRAGYSGYHYFCVYAYAPSWTGWYTCRR